MPEAKSPFHRGEKEIQSRLGIEDRMEGLGRRMIRDHMPEEHRAFFSGLPLLIVGTIDPVGRPWASALAGEPGFVRAADSRTLRVAGRPIYGDPLSESLVDGADIGALGLEFQSRRRNRVNGKVGRRNPDGFQIRVAQSFGICPKYIQARRPAPGGEIESMGRKKPVHRGDALTKDQAAIVARADTLFIVSQFSEDAADWTHGVDVSHRGGKPGFVLVAHETLLLLPDYSGNCMFNTLGNIAINPKCGLLFIDFDTGDTLQLTGEAEILWEPAHTRRFPGAKRVLAFGVEEALQIERALPFINGNRCGRSILGRSSMEPGFVRAADSRTTGRSMEIAFELPRTGVAGSSPITNPRLEACQKSGSVLRRHYPASGRTTLSDSRPARRARHGVARCDGRNASPDSRTTFPTCRAQGGSERVPMSVASPFHAAFPVSHRHRFHFRGLLRKNRPRRLCTIRDGRLPNRVSYQINRQLSGWYTGDPRLRGANSRVTPRSSTNSKPSIPEARPPRDRRPSKRLKSVNVWRGEILWEPAHTTLSRRSRGYGIRELCELRRCR